MGCRKGIPMHEYTNPIVEHGADPYVIWHDGFYYYIHTMGDRQLGIRKAAQFYLLEQSIPNVVWTPPEGSMYCREIWAPELHFINNKWYIYVAADDGKNENHRMYVLESDYPDKDFVLCGKITDKTDKWAIDGTVLHFNNKMYFVWSGWEGDQNIRQDIYIAPMSDPKTICGDRVKISTPELDWELLGTPDDGSLPYINEGPAVLQKDNMTHIVYSASGSWCDDYCLGLLTLAGNDPLDPNAWVKKSQPIFTKIPECYGPGHNSFCTGPDGDIWIFYHANKISGSRWDGRSVRVQKVNFDQNGYPQLGSPIPPGQIIRF